MITMTVAEAKNRLSDVLRRAEYGGERVVVERHGKPVAAIVSTDDLKRLEATDDKADLRDARAALACDAALEACTSILSATPSIRPRHARHTLSRVE